MNRRIPLIIASLLVLGAFVVWLISGPTALLGYGIGVAGTSFNLGALWGVIRLGSKAWNTEKAPRIGAALVLIGFFVKLPILVALIWWVQKIGSPAPGGFLAGLGLVYSAMVGWAQASR